MRLAPREAFPALAGAVAGGLATAGLLVTGPRDWPLLVLLLPLALAADAGWERLAAERRQAVTAALATAAAFLAIRCGVQMARNLLDVPEWDFHAFWLAGRVAATGGLLYEPSSWSVAAAGLEPSPEFQAEILEVGFFYPPPLALLLAPLGWFETPRWALVPWYGVMVAAALACIFLVRRTFLPGPSRAAGTAVAAVLVLAHPASLEVVGYGQTNFIMLLAILAYGTVGTPRARGLWLALAVVLKPVVAALSVEALLRRRWAVLGTTVAACAGATLLAGLALGLENVTGYFPFGPVNRLPAFVYTEPVNQSLLATVLRARGREAAGLQPLLDPVFLGLATTVLLVTVLAARRGLRRWRGHALATSLTAGLLLYPGTLGHYSLVLIVPLMWWWSGRQRLAGGTVGALALVLAAYVLADIGRAFGAHLGVWAALVAASWRLPADDRRALDFAPRPLSECPLGPDRAQGRP